MKILQVQFKNRNGHTLRHRDPARPRRVPGQCICTALPAAAADYKSMYAHLSRSGSAGHQQRGSISTATARCGRFEDMSFDGLPDAHRISLHGR